MRKKSEKKSPAGGFKAYNPPPGACIGGGAVVLSAAAVSRSRRVCSSVRLERTPDKGEVDSSILSRPTITIGGVRTQCEASPQE